MISIDNFFSPLTSAAKVCSTIVPGSLAVFLMFTSAEAAQPPAIDGSQIFTSAGCAGCHGATGLGGMGAKLTSDQKLSDAQFVAHQILFGGQKMPPFGSQLDDAQIAAVATYVRTHFGNEFGNVDTQTVADARKNPQAAAAEPGEEGGAQKPSTDTQVVGADPTDVQQPTGPAKPTQAELDKADTATDSWLIYNKGYTGQRYSSLKQIDTGNVSRLQPVCALQLGEVSSFQTGPVVYDGIAYLTTQYSTFAVDAKTCHVIWKYTYATKGPEPIDTNRGIAIAGGRVFRGTTDAHLIALDAKTGKLLWNARPVDSADGYFLSSAPIVWNDLVITGTAGADWGAPAFLYAFDVKDGHKVWEFNEIDPSTFGGAEPASTGGGSNWTSYAIDLDKGLLYAPVGNPAPDFAAQYRPGDNLYTNSVIAVDLRTGKLDHYYQQIPNDSLDRDTAAAPILFKPDPKAKANLVAVANKAGNLFVYDEADKSKRYVVDTTTIENAGKKPTVEGLHACPGINGGVEWNGPAYDHQTGLLYVGSVDWCTTYTLGEIRYNKGQLFFGGSYNFDPVETARGWIRAYNASTGKDAWSYKSDLPVVSSVTPTAGGLVFSGELTGDFIALNSRTGKVLYRFFTGGPIGGGVVTYSLDGNQYVLVPSGNTSRTWTPATNSAATVFIFGLPGTGPSKS